MNKNLIIKKITHQESNSLFEVFSKIVKTEFPEYSSKVIQYLLTHPRAFTKESFKRKIEEESHWALLAYIKGTLVGFIYGEATHGGVSSVYWLGIDREFQRKGIGSVLLLKWETIVKEEGAHVIHLYTFERDLGFYEKLGYKTIGLDKKSYYGVDLHILRKHIQEPREENYLK